MTDDELIELLDVAAQSVADALDSTDRWGLVDGSGHQHHSDLVADRAAGAVLRDAGVSVLSEESGLAHPVSASGRGSEGSVVVVVDPLDGSTNAAQGIPWFATSLCVVDDRGPSVAVVRNLATGTIHRAVRGSGATRDGRPIAPSGCTDLGEAIVALSDLPTHRYPWRQYRTLGAAALDLCAVADGTLDGFVDCGTDQHGVWDYLGGLLVCVESGAPVGEAEGRDLVTLDHGARRTPVAAATPELLAALLEQRRGSR